ncbi:hypothetical protein MNBD_NITROSPINAE01-1199 [hydrothermal vent metagenome]|uniref:DUF2079 domain-containing protein n=1 Tax=hydrothermal vent metagenome TaxID=652676 RepID=A0A3B1BHC9_9ZZZZ
MTYCKKPGSTVVLLLLAVLIATYTGWFTYHSIDRWASLNNDWWDVGNIDSAAYNTAHGKFMYSNAELGSFWSDHFAPILLVLSAYYLFDDGYWFIYFWQSLTIALTAIPIFLLGLEFFKNDRVALLLAVVYLANGYIHAGNLFDYHMVSHIGLFFFSAFYAMVKKRWGWFFVFGALLMFCKEDAPIIFFMLGFYALLVQKEYKIAFVTWAVAVAYVLFVFGLAIPYLREVSHNVWGDRGTYYYNKDYVWLGESTLDKLKTLLFSPRETFDAVFSNPMRAGRWEDWVTAYAFLPFLSFTGLIILIPSSLELLLNARVTVSSLLFHYPLMLAPLWTLAMILALVNVRKLAEMASKWNIGSKPNIWANVVGRITMVTAILYISAILVFILMGAYDFTVFGLRVRMGEPGKPLLILLAVFVIHIFFAPGSAFSKIFGADLKTRVTVIPLLYMLFVNVLITKNSVPLILTDDGRQVFRENRKIVYDDIFINPATLYSKEHREHAKIVHESVKMIPKGATVVTSPEVYGIMYHNTNTFLYRGASEHPFTDMEVEWGAIDLKGVPVKIGPPLYDRRRAILEFFNNPNYGLVLERDGLFIFKKGADRASAYKWFIDRALTFYASEFGKIVGSDVEDASAIGGMARAALASKTPDGTLLYGPYVSLPKGDYSVTFRIKAEGALDKVKLKLDIAGDEGKKIFGEKMLTGYDFPEPGKWMEIEIPFTITADITRKVEFRVFYFSGADVFVDEVRLHASLDTFLQRAFLPNRKIWRYSASAVPNLASRISDR